MASRKRTGNNDAGLAADLLKEEEKREKAQTPAPKRAARTGSRQSSGRQKR